jgi:hypothetical protein
MYEVGQIIYSILEDKYKVVPLRVSEQVITKTLDGETISYKVIVPGKNNKKISLSSVSNVWTNLEDVKLHLIDNANNAINKMLNETNNIQNKYFIEEEKVIEKVLDTCINDPNIDTIIKQSPDDSIIKVDLGNGQIGILKTDNEELDQKKNEEYINT